MNRFKQKLKDYNDTIANPEVDPSTAALAYNRKDRFLDNIYTFCEESNAIEGVYDEEEVRISEVNIHNFLGLDNITIADLCSFNTVHGRLRTNGECVTVGKHTPPKGGQHILYKLESIVEYANQEDNPFEVHQEFEQLHPFTDGNGRTGRALWLWQMINQNLYNCENLFLQQWYYQSLDKGRK